MVFSVFLMFAVFRLLPPQGGESVAPYQAFGAHLLMQITETLHIMHCSKSLYTNITPFFSALQADPSDSANDTKTAPISCYGNRGGSIALFVLFQALTQLLAGVLDRSLRGCQNYRAFRVTMIRCNDDTLFVNFQCVLPHLRNDLLQIFFLQIEFRQFCLVI